MYQKFNFIHFISKRKIDKSIEEGKLDVEAVKHLRMHGGTDQIDVLYLKNFLIHFLHKNFFSHSL